ncbi:MAG: hypothetical protein SFV18_07730 [Bryobacteraceae bacterium]|nr:hypothetical protein [Bryobacteraceae bacterium]
MSEALATILENIERLEPGEEAIVRETLQRRHPAFDLLGKYKGYFSPHDEFLAQKREEIELENRRIP